MRPSGCLLYTVGGGADERMGKLLMLTVVFVPVLLGVVTARRRRLRAGLRQLLVATLLFDVAYMMLLYYLIYDWL